MNEGQGWSSLLEGISLGIVVSNYGDNPFTNNKNIQKYSKNY